MLSISTCSVIFVIFLLIKYKKLYQFYQTCKTHDTYLPSKYIFASILDLEYNTFLLYPRPITLEKRYLRFYRCHGPCTFDKTGEVSLYLIFAVFIPLQLY